MDSVPQQGVPSGKVRGPFEWKSTIYPGTRRHFWIYEPSRVATTARGKKPLCLLVLQDGLRMANQGRLPVVMDNLIHKEDIPEMIGVFIDPGYVPAPHARSQPRMNRSFEYDSMGDRYVQFLVQEIIPEVEKKYVISKDPNDRMIAGSSSGAICAFTAAWEHPDLFRRVFSAIGTDVSLRGGNEYSSLVRKHEARPLRVFYRMDETIMIFMAEAGGTLTRVCCMRFDLLVTT